MRAGVHGAPWGGLYPWMHAGSWRSGVLTAGVWSSGRAGPGLRIHGARQHGYETE